MDGDDSQRSPPQSFPAQAEQVPSHLGTGMSHSYNEPSDSISEQHDSSALENRVKGGLGSSSVLRGSTPNVPLTDHSLQNVARVPFGSSHKQLDAVIRSESQPVTETQENAFLIHADRHTSEAPMTSDSPERAHVDGKPTVASHHSLTTPASHSRDEFGNRGLYSDQGAVSPGNQHPVASPTDHLQDSPSEAVGAVHNSASVLNKSKENLSHDRVDPYQARPTPPGSARPRDAFRRTNVEVAGPESKAYSENVVPLEARVVVREQQSEAAPLTQPYDSVDALNGRVEGAMTQIQPKPRPTPTALPLTTTSTVHLTSSSTPEVLPQVSKIAKEALRAAPSLIDDSDPVSVGMPDLPHKESLVLPKTGDLEPQAVPLPVTADAKAAVRNFNIGIQEALARITVRMADLPPSSYGISKEDLLSIVDFDNRVKPEQLIVLEEKYGGVAGVAALVRTDLHMGLSLAASSEDENETKPTDSQERLASTQKKFSGLFSKRERIETDLQMKAGDRDRREGEFGKNVIPPPPSDTILEIVWDTVKDDPIIKLLLVGAVVILIIGTATHPESGWYEGVAIFVAVAIVLTVTAGNDYSKDQKFKQLLLLQSDKKVKVVRGGTKDSISSWNVLVGDLVEISVGDEIPADGLLVQGNRLVIDESPLTGESLPVQKNIRAPFLFSGCLVSEGSAMMIVTAVGTSSSGGRIQELLNDGEDDLTVLQAKLRDVAVLIGKVGITAGVLTFLALAIRWAAAMPNRVQTGGWQWSYLTELATYFTVGVTLIVVAVPEGLPLAVTISLAYSMFKMMKDNCFVRHLDASETMGEATCVCTDKTGTLTENRMTVVKAMIGDRVIHGEGSGEKDAIAFSPTTLTPRMQKLVSEAISSNSTAFVKYKTETSLPTFVGSASEGALLVFNTKLGSSYESARRACGKVDNGVWLFSSERKRMSTIIEPFVPTPGGKKEVKFRLHTKGASEILLGLCTRAVNAKGDAILPMDDKREQELRSTIKEWASEGLRTLILAFRDMNELPDLSDNNKEDPEFDLTFLALVGIKDPLRKEVPGAVAACQKAGLVVRMVTGDNVLTASKIARECGILFGEGIAMEGPVFRALSKDEKIAILPRLQVMARSSPSDKHTLVSLLQELGEVVAVTGDGTNDAPALKEADIGFAMGIAGTQIALNACDIILMDDNFVSVVHAIRWGRNVLNCVRKFLQFQLAVNIVALSITIIGSVVVGYSPLNAVQLLWVNLIMDSLGALALATDEPDDDILSHPPHGRTQPLISRPMQEYIISQVVYQLIVLISLMFSATQIVPLDPQFHGSTELTERNNGLIFSTFVLLQAANEITARQLNGEINIFAGFLRNKMFLAIIFVICFIQVVIIQFFGSFLQVVPLTPWEWGVCSLFAAGGVPWMVLCRLGSLTLAGETPFPWQKPEQWHMLVRRNPSSNYKVHPEPHLLSKSSSPSANGNHPAILRSSHGLQASQTDAVRPTTAEISTNTGSSMFELARPGSGARRLPFTPDADSTIRPALVPLQPTRSKTLGSMVLHGEEVVAGTVEEAREVLGVKDEVERSKHDARRGGSRETLGVPKGLSKEWKAAVAAGWFIGTLNRVQAPSYEHPTGPSEDFLHSWNLLRRHHNTGMGLKKGGGAPGRSMGRLNGVPGRSIGRLNAN
ncbi:Calcium-transporting ATPase 10, plasma membrane-type [Gonapodya sp. JEL0774]|nr:Calcium-transporting ATPase 10, plasma membrane-type [Gonapodya sp. JEL0774]